MKFLNIIKSILEKLIDAIKRLKSFFKKVFLLIKRSVNFDKENFSNKFSKLLIIFILVSISVLLIGIYDYVAKKSMILTDDYDHYNTVITMPTYIEGNDFHNAIEYAKWDCMNLGGRYFTMFIQYFFGIKRGIDNIKNYANIMSKNVIIYFMSILFFVFSLVHNFIKDKKQILNQIIITFIMYLSFIISFNGFNYYPQIFNWYPGATSYTIPLSCFLISLGCILFLIDSNNLVFIILSLIFGYFSMGGSLCIVSTAYTILAVFFVSLIVSKKMNIKILLLMLNIFIFGIVNLISPGNFNRRELQLVKDDLTIMNVLNVSLEYINGRIKNLFFNPFELIVLLIFAGMIAYILLKYFKINFSYFITFPIMVLLPLASTIPIVAGIGEYELYKQLGVYDRIAFIIDFSLIIAFLNVFIMIYLSISILFKCSKRPIAVLCLMVVFCSLIFKHNKDYIFFNDIHIIEIVDNIIQNKYEIVYDEYLQMIDDLENGRGKDNVVVRKPKTIVTHYYNFELRGTENFFYEIKNLNYK